MADKTRSIGYAGGSNTTQRLVDQGDGTHAPLVALAGDIEVGAVELKNGADDTRAVIAAGTSIVAADPALAVKDFTVGKTTDAAVVTDANGTLASFLRGIVKMLAASVAGTGPLAVSYPVATYTDRSGTITVGGTAQVLMALNASRKGFWIQNNSAADQWISSVGTAGAIQPSLKLVPGAYYEAPANGVPTTAISIYGATTGQTFSAREW